MIEASLKKNDSRARFLILTVSIVVFAVVVLLPRLPRPELGLPFSVHVFATINALLNTMVAVLLVAALIAVKSRKFKLHRNLMLFAIVLSVLFLVSYIAHHLLAGDTKFGGTGSLRLVYFVILITHIALAAIILPFILFTSYRALVGEFATHKKLARITWPIWFYVAVTGPIVYLMISPYYVN